MTAALRRGPWGRAMDKKTLFDIVTNSVREVVPELASHPFVAEDHRGLVDVLHARL